MAKARKGYLPTQAWDEINVTNPRTQTPQQINVIVKMPKPPKMKKEKKK